jgi:SEC-C motif
LYRHRRSETKPKSWFERSEGLLLLLQQQLLVKAHYPGLTFQADSESGRMLLEGDFVLKADCGIPTTIRIRIRFPSNYPSSEPTAYDAGAFFPTDVDRHILSTGAFCLWLPPCSPWDETDPNGSLLRFLDEVTVFLERQLVYDATGGKQWPGPQYRHGKYGYLDFMLSILDGNEELLNVLLPAILGKMSPGRNDVCPCGGPLKYKRCHSSLVEQIVGRIGRGTLHYFFKDSGKKDSSEEKPSLGDERKSA